MSGQRLLSLVSLGLGLLATGILSLAVVTDYWLFISEPFVPQAESDMDTDNASPDVEQIIYSQLDENYISHTKETISGDFRSGSTMTVYVKVHSGLWRMCTTVEDGPTTCAIINYQDWRRITDVDTTWSILRAIRKASPVIVFSLLLMIVAFALSTLGNYNKDTKTIAGAIMYILSGLLLAVGVIIYISAVNDEVAHRKNPGVDGSVFEYHYGWAFSLAGVAFVCSMMTGVTNITIYLNRFPTVEEKTSIIPGLEKSEGFALPNLMSEDEMRSTVRTRNVTVIL